jgi:hypothetical protein
MSRVRCFSVLPLLAVFALPLHAQAPAATAPPTSEPTLDQVRELTTRYRDVKVALADGYIADPSGMCVSAAMEGFPADEGAMGVHYLRPDLLGITGPPNPRVNGTGTHTDFRQPAILIYEPQADGSSKLVAVENLVFLKSWEAAGHTSPPTFQGQTFNRMVDDPATKLDEAHNFEPHYDLHVWLYRENPKGMFAQFNPKASCEHQGKMD